MNHLSGITVLVLGLGESGLAMARWCARCGADVRVWDSRSEPPNAARLAQLVPAAVRLQGPLDADALAAALAGARLVLKSPGLAPHDPLIASVLALAAQMSVPVQNELDLYSSALVDLKAARGYAPKVLAITGTNGKTTTTAMTALLVARTGRRVAMAGNIGPTLLQTLADALDLEPAVASSAAPMVGEPAPVFMHLPEVWVLELSSFQLDGVQGFEADAAAVLNVTQDHLDWHGDMASYLAAKARVYGQHAVMVVNRDDARVGGLAQPGGVEGEHPGVDLGDRALLVGRVLLLDDREDVARTHLAHDPAVPRRIGDVGGEDRDGVAVGRVGREQLGQRRAVEQGDVTRDHDDGAVDDCADGLGGSLVAGEVGVSGGVEHRVAIIGVEKVDDQSASHGLGIVAEQTCHCAIDRSDAPVGAGQDDHAVHVGHHRAQHLGVALVELEPVTVGDIACNDHDQAGQRVRQPGSSICPTELEIPPRATTGANPQHE